MESGWSCSCEDHYFKNICCKHIHAVEISLSIREQVRKQIIINEVTVDSCPVCNSDNLRKDGIRHNKNYSIQRYRCKDCNKKFSINLGFENMKASPEIITNAMQLYFTGESLRGVEKFIKLQGINFSHVAIYQWIKKYTKLIELMSNSLTSHR